MHLHDQPALSRPSLASQSELYVEFLGVRREARRDPIPLLTGVDLLGLAEALQCSKHLLKRSLLILFLEEDAGAPAFPLEPVQLPLLLHLLLELSRLRLLETPAHERHSSLIDLVVEVNGLSDVHPRPLHLPNHVQLIMELLALPGCPAATTLLLLLTACCCLLNLHAPVAGATACPSSQFVASLLLLLEHAACSTTCADNSRSKQRFTF